MRETGWGKLESNITELTSETGIRCCWAKQVWGHDECWVLCIRQF